MLPSVKLAIAAHMHVLLRRKTGRVSDTEWMATNAEYGAEIVRFAREKAREDGHTDLAELADRLEQALQADPLVRKVPLAQTAVQMLRARAAEPTLAPATDHSGFSHSVSPDSSFAESPFGAARKARDPNVPRYVGGIR